MVLPFARALGGSAGAAAFTAVGPLWMGIALVAAILFGPQGMSAADAVSALEASPALRLGLWAAWLVAAAPAARLVFETADAFFLRSLPVARWQFWLFQAALLAGLQLPWVLLHARGGGLRAAVDATCLSVGAHALLCARAAGPLALAATGALLVAAAAGALESAAGLSAAAVGVPTAFRRAPERAARARAGRVRGPAPVALALSYLVAVPRTSPAAVVRALIVTAAGAALTVLVARNNQVTGAGAVASLSLGVLTFTVVVATGGADRAVAAAEQATGWILAATGTPRRIALAASIGAVAGCAGLAGLLHGAVVAAAVGGGPVRAAGIIGASVVWGAVAAAAVARVRRRKA